MYNYASLVDRLLMIIPLLLSLSIHEWAHARTAFALGDDTAYLLGRVSLNPLKHIDPIGTVLFPLLGVPVGWAKPVPFNPTRFSMKVSVKLGTVLVALAGPVSNFMLAICCFLAQKFLLQTALASSPNSYPIAHGILALVTTLFATNLLLGMFNLLPIGPLDGNQIVTALLPDSAQRIWAKLGPFVTGIVVGLFLWFYFAPAVLNIYRVQQ